MNLEKNGERNESLHRRALQTIQQPIVDLADDHRGQRGMSCVRALSTPVLPERIGAALGFSNGGYGWTGRSS